MLMSRGHTASSLNPPLSKLIFIHHFSRSPKSNSAKRDQIDGVSPSCVSLLEPPAFLPSSSLGQEGGATPPRRQDSRTACLPHLFTKIVKSQFVNFCCQLLKNRQLSSALFVAFPVPSGTTGSGRGSAPDLHRGIGQEGSGGAARVAEVGPCGSSLLLSSSDPFLPSKSLA